MSEHLEDWFTNAQEKYANAVRTAFVVVAVLLAVHLTTITQYVATRAQLQATREESARLEAVSGQSRTIAGQVQALEEAVADGSRQLLDKWVDDLRADFLSLDDAIAVARGGVAADRPRPLMAVQMPLNAAWIPPERNPVSELPPDLSGRLKEADPFQVSGLVLPWVKEKIIAPRFAELQRAWQQELAPRLVRQVDTIRTMIHRLPAEPPAIRDSAAALERQITALAAEVAAFEIAPPDNDRWWRTVAGKGAVATAIGESAADRLKAAVATDSARRLDQFAAAAVTGTKAMETELEASLAECAANFKRQVEQAETLAKPLAMIALDLQYVTTRFPLLLSFALAAAIFWPAYCKLQLARAYARLLFAEPAARRWGHTFGWLETRRRWLGLPAAGAVAWIAVASWQLEHWAVVTPGQSLALAALAGLPIAGAAVSVWWMDALARRLCGLSQQAHEVRPN